MTVVIRERDSHFLAVNTDSAIESWPLAGDESWRVVAWPNWRTGGDLMWMFRELGPALAEKGACLCLRHDPEIDGPLENAETRLADVLRATESAGSHPRVAIINGAAADTGWNEISESINAKVASRNSSDSRRNAPIDNLPVVELRTRADVERLLTDDPVLKPLDRYRKQFANVPGWFRMPAISIWDSLLTLQSDHDVAGNFLEIGVWMGRSALLSTLHSSEDEQCVFVDPLRTEAEDRLRSVRKSGLHFIQSTSRSLSAAMLPGGGAPSYRWIHIDGEHSGTAVEHDVALASSILAPRGIIVIDDFFDAAYPQITFAVIEHLRAHPKSLMMFLCGYSKAYLCHPSDGRWLLKHVAEKLNDDMVERGAQPVTLFKTADPIDLNCFGIGPRVEGTALRGPDWKTDSIEY